MAAKLPVNVSTALSEPDQALVLCHSLFYGLCVTGFASANWVVDLNDPSLAEPVPPEFLVVTKHSSICSWLKDIWLVEVPSPLSELPSGGHNSA